MLMHLGRITPVVVILLVCREIAITGLRAIASAEGIVLSASGLAKWKTATQMVAIPMLMLHETYLFIPFQLVGTILILISLLISLWSAKDYIVDFFKTLQSAALKRRDELRAKRLMRRAERVKRMIEANPELADAVKQAVDKDKPQI
jgi:phosphatidylglycerophosphate synthase